MTRSQQLFETAQHHLVGGVNSPVRSFRSVGGTPVFIKRASGSTVTDVDGRSYIDYVGSWGPAILGHAHPQVLQAVQAAMADGLSFGAPCEKEITLAELVKKAFPSIELVRFVSSGTEATMGALRLARGFTGRSKIIKFNGCYHGHADSLLVRAGSGALTLGEPDSAGVPPEFAKHTLVAEYNDLDSVDRLLEANRALIAAVIVEPVVGNMGCVPPQSGFLEGLRARCSQEGIVFIFDEVMTGFRVALGGAQARYGITPDLTCLGKVVGGGMPVGAFGGRRDIMECLAPKGPVYQAGTLSGNPVAMAAGISTLRLLMSAAADSYAALEARGAQLQAGIDAAVRRKGIAACVQRVGSMWTLFFSDGPMRSFADVERADLDRFRAFFHAMLRQGIYLAPSQFEACFISLAHSEDDIARTIAAVEQAL